MSLAHFCALAVPVASSSQTTSTETRRNTDAFSNQSAASPLDGEFWRTVCRSRCRENAGGGGPDAANSTPAHVELSTLNRLRDGTPIVFIRISLNEYKSLFYRADNRRVPATLVTLAGGIN